MRIILTTIFFLSIQFYSWSQADTNIILKHLKTLVGGEARNYKNTERLQDAAVFIYNELAQYADTVSLQPIVIGERVYVNVIASFGVQHIKRLIVGAHYDVCGDQNGADDNATGIAGLLEIARLLNGKQLSKRIDLVAYTLEEPPFYASEFMGSLIHAKSLTEENAEIEGMICLEMIGYFSDEKHSQDYPLKFLKLLYGNRGDYITVVNKMSPGKFARKFTRRFKKISKVEAKKFQAPKSLTGIDFSDHRSYWSEGYSAVMITDTAFYRNKNYHEETDTIETLDLRRMAQVIDAVFLSLGH